MAVTSPRARLWRVLLVAAGVLALFTVAALWPSSGPPPAPEGSSAAEASDEERQQALDEVSKIINKPKTSSRGPASRQVLADCNVASAADPYADLAGQTAHVTLLWEGMESGAADLKIPVRVERISDNGVEVAFGNFPLREHYIPIWLSSGHIKHAEADRFAIDPCSAKFEASAQ